MLWNMSDIEVIAYFYPALNSSELDNKMKF